MPQLEPGAPGSTMAAPKQPNQYVQKYLNDTTIPKEYRKNMMDDLNSGSLSEDEAQHIVITNFPQHAVGPSKVVSEKPVPGYLDRAWEGTKQMAGQGMENISSAIKEGGEYNETQKDQGFVDQITDPIRWKNLTKAATGVAEVAYSPIAGAVGEIPVLGEKLGQGVEAVGQGIDYMKDPIKKAFNVEPGSPMDQYVDQIFETGKFIAPAKLGEKTAPYVGKAIGKTGELAKKGAVKTGEFIAEKAPMVAEGAKAMVEKGRQVVSAGKEKAAGMMSTVKDKVVFEPIELQGKGKPSIEQVTKQSSLLPTERGLAAEKISPVTPSDVTPTVIETVKNTKGYRDSLSQEYEVNIDAVGAKYGETQMPRIKTQIKEGVNTLLKDEFNITRGPIEQGGKYNLKKNTIGDPAGESLVKRMIEIVNDKAPTTAAGYIKLLKDLKAEVSKAQNRSGAKVATQKIYSKVRDVVGENIPEIQALNEAYRKGMKPLNDVQSILESSAKSEGGKAISLETRLSGLLKDSKTGARELIEAFEEAAHGRTYIDKATGETRTIDSRGKIVEALKREAARVEGEIVTQKLTKESITRAAKEIKMDVTQFNNLISDVVRGEPTAIQQITEIIYKNKGGAILGTFGLAVAPIIIKLLSGDSEQ